MSKWFMNIRLPVESVISICQDIEHTDTFSVPSGAGLQFGDEAHIRIRDADPDEGTDISVFDWPEELGWRVYDFLAERTTAKMWMMDEGGLLLTARGLTPDDVGHQLAVNRVPSTVHIYDDHGGYEEWRPESNPRAGTLT